MKYGYFVAVFGLVVFFLVVFVAASMRLQGPIARLVGQGALLFMAVSFWLGTAIVAVEKGYHVLIGVVLGFFAPLGLLVLTLMPDLSRRR